MSPFPCKVRNRAGETPCGARVGQKLKRGMGTQRLGGIAFIVIWDQKQPLSGGELRPVEKRNWAERALVEFIWKVRIQHPRGGVASRGYQGSNPPLRGGQVGYIETAKSNNRRCGFNSKNYKCVDGRAAELLLIAIGSQNRSGREWSINQSYRETASPRWLHYDHLHRGPNWSVFYAAPHCG